MNYRAVLSKYRSAIMGIMAIVIVLFHAGWLSPVRLYNSLINMHGNTAVDVFVFISGFGLAYSLQKGDPFSKYFSRRLERILPSYYAYLLIGTLTMLLAFYRDADLSTIANFLHPRLLPISIWLNSPFPRWYISATLGFYVIAAILYPAMRRSRFLYVTSALLLVVTVWYAPSVAHLDNSMIAIARIPSLVVGLTVGAAAQREEPRYRKPWLGLAGLLTLSGVSALMFAFRDAPKPAVVELIGVEAYHRIMKTLTAPLVSVAIAYGFLLCDRIHIRFIPRFFGWLGRYSLEIYLSHSLMNNILDKMSLSVLQQMLLNIPLCIPLAVLFSWAGGWLLRFWKRLLKPLTRP